MTRARRISKAQICSLYWPSWRAAEKVLLAHDHSKEEAEEIRKEIHVNVTGSACSSKDLTNRQLDECLKQFAAIATPTDGKRQADLANAACKRVRFKITEIQKRMQLTDAYIETMAVNMTRRSLIQCDEEQLKSILKALVYHEQRHSGKSEETHGA